MPLPMTIVKTRLLKVNNLKTFLLANYLSSPQHTNEPISLIKESNYVPAENGFHIHENKANRKHRHKEEVINGTPMSNSVEKVTKETPKAPRAERLVMIPEAVSNFFPSITSSISYFDGSDPPSPSQGRAFSNTKPELNEVQVEEKADEKPASTDSEKP